MVGKNKSKSVCFRLTPVASAVMVALATQSVQAGPGWGISTYPDGHMVQTYYANSPSGMRADPKVLAASNGATVNNTIDTGTALRKFVDPLPGLCPANRWPSVTKSATTGTLLNKCIPVAVPDKKSYPGSDYYEIGVVEYQEYMHADLPKPTRLRGYVQLNANGPGKPPLTSVDTVTGKVVPWPTPHYLGPIISSTRGTPVRVKFVNLLPNGESASVIDPATGKVTFVGPRNGDLFIPVDRTLMGAGLGPDGATMFRQNRAELHLHGGDTPWISDGTPHQWIVPAADEKLLAAAGMKEFARGAVAQNVPDMPDPGPGAVTYYWPNNQSARLMFYHDHTAGLTRLNVYAGEAAGYLISDDAEKALIASGAIPDATSTIPLVIQEKTFVPKDIALQDAKWNEQAWGTYGDLWFPHVYEVNQDPNSGDGTNPVGRWDWGPYFWPVFPSLYSLPTGDYGDVTTTPEAFLDTPVVNGTAYPYLTVDPKAYRFRILNATNDRFLNLGLYIGDTSQCGVPNLRCATDLRMVRFNAGVAAFPTTGGIMGTGWGQPDGRAGGVPSPSWLGPNIVQIGTEGGFLPQVVDIPSTPINYEYGRRSITVLNINEHGLLMGAAERADVVIDFSKYAGRNIILYNDAPSPVPAFDPRIDYHLDPTNPAPYDDYLSGGAMPTKVGYGPNTRTIMQIRVRAVASVPGPGLNMDLLKAELPKAYAASQDKPIIPQTAYNAAWPGIAASDQYAKIATGTLQQPTFDFVPADPGVMGGLQLSVDPVSKLPMTGSGYVTVPTVAVVHPTGTGAMASAVLKIGHISVTRSGSGYVNAPLVTVNTLPPAGSITPAAGGGATGMAFLKVVGVKKIAGGAGYQAGTTVTVSAPDGWAKYGVDRADLGIVRAAVSPVIDPATGEITSLTIDNPGAGYTVLPKVYIAGVGTGASFELDAGVERIDLTSPQPGRPDLAGGRGYTDMTRVAVNLTGGGIGGTPVNAGRAVATGAVSEVTLASGGTGYTATPTPPTVVIAPPVFPVGYVLPADVSAVQAMAEPTSNSKMAIHNKAIQELFEPNYGRMNATLGIEMPFTSALIQTTIPLAYIDQATEQLKDGETQIWKITHNGVDSHPVHFHLANLQLVNRIGWDGTIKPPKPNELGWKETIMMNPLEDIVVAVRAKKPSTKGVTGANGFGLPQSVRLMDPTQPRYAMTGFTQIDVKTGNPAVVYNDIQNYNWEYVWHCHILGHEENDFMRPVVFDPNEAVPLPPTMVTPGGATASVARLEWVDNATTEYKYEILRSVDGVTNFELVGTALANAKSFDIPAAMQAIPAGGMWFVVRAVGANGTAETPVQFLN